MMGRTSSLLLLSVVLGSTLVGFSLSLEMQAGAQASGENNREPIVMHRTLACGVERWSVKTGTDPSAGHVNVHVVDNTSIIHLRSLTPPLSLPARARIGPVEYTVWRVSGYLLRVKQEADSDYHLVLADSGGRTMIAEIPSPACVGTSSPFLPQIRYVRSVFTSRFHPTEQWQRGRWPVQVTGVGFFDFKHGQSGVAPNAIELHPVLGVHFGGSVPVSAPPAPPHRSKPALPPAHGSLFVRASVSPNPVAFGSYPTLTARSVRGASCSASVVYSTGRPPRSFDGSAKTVGSSGSVGWSWHMESRGTGGTATVACSLGGQSTATTVPFMTSRSRFRVQSYKGTSIRGVATGVHPSILGSSPVARRSRHETFYDLCNWA